MIHTLYKTTNLVNKKFYLGVHTTEDIAFGCDNWEDPYVGSGHNIWAALKKYGRDKFQVEIVAYFDEEDYAYDAEKDIVTEEWLTTNKGVCYNINVGGNKPPKMTSEVAKKCANTRRMTGVELTRAKKAYLTKLKNGTLSEIGKRVYQTRLKNGTYESPSKYCTSESGKRAHQTAVKNGTYSMPPKMTSEASKKGHETKRKNRILLLNIKGE